MSKTDIILIFLIAASSFLVLCLSFIILARQNKKAHDYIIALIFFLYGVCLLCNTYYREGTEYLTPHLSHINTSLVYFLAPLIYFYFKSILNKEFQLKRDHLFLFIPGIIVFLGLTPFYILDAPSKLALSHFPDTDHSSMGLWTNILKIAGASIIFISFGLTLHSTSFLWNKTSLTHIKIIRRLLIYVAVWVFLAGIYTIADLTGNILLYRTAYLTGNLMLFLYFLYTCRNPDFFSKIQKESKEIKYLNSRLRSIDKENVITRLDSLMVQDEIYKDSLITLKKLSCELKITPPSAFRTSEQPLRKQF